MDAYSKPKTGLAERQVTATPMQQINPVICDTSLLTINGV
nr:Putative uncharacterized protein [Moritella viscosa]SHO18934.1 Putative uncharacterized protein [Moritella viscosa]